MNIHSITIAIFLAASVSHAQGMNMDKPAPNLAETLDPDLLDIKNAIRDCQAADLINKKISFRNLLYDPCKSMSFLKSNRDQLLASAEVAVELAKNKKQASLCQELFMPLPPLSHQQPKDLLCRSHSLNKSHLPNTQQNASSKSSVT